MMLFFTNFGKYLHFRWHFFLTDCKNNQTDRWYKVFCRLGQVKKNLPVLIIVNIRKINFAPITEHVAYANRDVIAMKLSCLVNYGLAEFIFSGKIDLAGVCKN